MQLPPMQSLTEAMFGDIGDPTRNGLAPGGVSVDLTPKTADTPTQAKAAKAIRSSSSRSDLVAVALVVVGFMYLNQSKNKK